MKQFSKKNGYYKHYTSTGKKFRVKVILKKPEDGVNSNVLIKFKTDKEPESWWYTYPSEQLNSINAIINYLGKHTENNNNVYEVLVPSNIA